MYVLLRKPLTNRQNHLDVQSKQIAMKITEHDMEKIETKYSNSARFVYGEITDRGVGDKLAK